MAQEKLLAEWFWTDRWIGSSAFGLPIDARGLYREMLTQAWRRGAQLPNDYDQIRRMTGVTEREWRRAWPLIEKYWRVEGVSLVNDTQLEVYAEAQGRSVRASERGLRGAQARAQALLKQKLSTAQDEPECKPPSPSPSPIVPVLKNRQEQPRRKERPHVQNERFAVHRWQVDELISMLGVHVDTFDLDEWLMTGAAARAALETAVIPDWWKWLKAETLAEARRRGLPFAASEPAGKISGSTCPHVPRCASTTACIARTVADGRAARSA